MARAIATRCCSPPSSRGNAFICGQTDLGQRPVIWPLRSGASPHIERQPHIVGGRQRRKQMKRLENKAHSRLRRAIFGARLVGRPQMRTVPAVGVNMHPRIDRGVLPLPEGPMSSVSSPP
jgi:hypothetical protein